MIWNDDDDDQMDDLNSWYENLSEEEKSRMDREEESKWARMEDHPLYKKSREILDIVEAIIASLPEDERDYHSPVRESAMMLAPKFAGAYGMDMWLLVMQNAALMRYHAEYVATGVNGFEMLSNDQPDPRYLKMLREEMKEYKRLFNEWMNEVHAMPRDPEMDEDDWGVFRRA